MLYALAFYGFSHKHVSEVWDEVFSRRLSQKSFLSQNGHFNTASFCGAFSFVCFGGGGVFGFF